GSGAALLFERNLEVQQVAALGVAQAGQIKPGAVERRRDSAHVEENESGLGRVGFYGFRGELGRVHFLERLLSHRAFHFSSGKRQWILRSACVDVGQAPVEFIVGGGGNLLATLGNQ